MIYTVEVHAYSFPPKRARKKEPKYERGARVLQVATSQEEAIELVREEWCKDDSLNLMYELKVIEVCGEENHLGALLRSVITEDRIISSEYKQTKEDPSS